MSLSSQLNQEHIYAKEGANCFRQHLTHSYFKFVHYHGYLELLYGREGTSEVLVGQEIYTLTPGDLIIIRSGEVHDVRCTSKTAEYEVIQLSPPLYYNSGETIFTFRYFLPAFGDKGIDCPKYAESDLPTTRINAIISEIMEEMRGHRIGFGDMIRANVMQLMVILARTAGEEEETHEESFSPALARILQSVLPEAEKKFRTWTAREAAEYCHLSYAYFCRNFKTLFGISFSTYLDSLKQKEAERLLLTTSDSVTEIAEACGYTSDSYFISRFHEMHGISPRAYRVAAEKLKAKHHET